MQVAKSMSVLTYVSDIVTLFNNVRATRDMVGRKWTHHSTRNREGRTEGTTDGKISILYLHITCPDVTISIVTSKILIVVAAVIVVFSGLLDFL